MKTGIEFKKQAELKGITEWPSHPCSICGVWVGFEFYYGRPYFRSSCGCAWSELQKRTWDDVAGAYNIQEDPDVIAEMDEFWGFDKEQINKK